VHRPARTLRHRAAAFRARVTINVWFCFNRCRARRAARGRSLRAMSAQRTRLHSSRAPNQISASNYLEARVWSASAGAVRSPTLNTRCRGGRLSQEHHHQNRVARGRVARCPSLPRLVRRRPSIDSPRLPGAAGRTAAPECGRGCSAERRISSRDSAILRRDPVKRCDTFFVGHLCEQLSRHLDDLL
jgi:hypothetical protein